MDRPRLGSFVGSLGMAALLCAALVGCKESKPSSTATEIVQSTTPAAQPAADAATQQAQALFQQTCAICHGPSGAGDGPASANLNPKPRNYTDKAWQASVTDEELKQIILQGGAAVGKSPTMPGQPQLKDKPEVLTAMVAIIRGFGK
jgi:mono/diheme cytochrome c family protein